jgi:hypothetical protein
MSHGIAELQHIIVECAEKIELAMSGEDWQKLTIILQQRQELLEKKILFLSKEDRHVEVVGLIKKIQADDAGFLSILQQKKKELEKQLHYIKQGKKSIKAYEV